MTVRVIKDSVIYKKKIYRVDDTFAVSPIAGKSLIERGYVEKISDMPVFSDSTEDEDRLERLLLADIATGKTYQAFVKDGQMYFESEGLDES